MLSLTKPKFMLPIGGTYRHMVAYQKLAVEMGHDRSSVLIPGEGEVLEFSATHRPRVVERIETEQIMLDGLGVGDVGAIVLRDRRTLASEGIVVIMVPVEKSINRVRGEPDIVSRGFVYMKDSGAIVAEMKQIVNRHLRLKKGKIFDWHFIRRNIEEEVSRFLFKETGRKPLIVPVVIEV
ncbi:TPA: hypothetical protein DIV55_02845 [Patescibacteria group bacterium]|nr:hypothetical protein [Patescibacteria group bacterium]